MAEIKYSAGQGIILALAAYIKAHPDVPLNVCIYNFTVVDSIQDCFEEEHYFVDRGVCLFRGHTSPVEAAKTLYDFGKIDKLPLTPEEAQAIYDSLPWKKGVFLFILS